MYFTRQLYMTKLSFFNFSYSLLDSIEDEMNNKTFYGTVFLKFIVHTIHMLNSLIQLSY